MKTMHHCPHQICTPCMFGYVVWAEL
eukprot:COSAG02_NODE_45203_length_359_cov_0.800000_1_plen_25_part_10